MLTRQSWSGAVHSLWVRYPEACFGFVWGESLGWESLHPQESQCIGADVSSGLCGEVSASGDERACGRGVKRCVRGDREALGDYVFGNRAGSRSRALPDPVGADLQSDADCDDGEECDRARSVCEGAGSEAQAVGRGILGERVFCEHGWAARQRKCDRSVCGAARRGSELSAIAQRAVGFEIVLKMPRGLPRGFFTFESTPRPIIDPFSSRADKRFTLRVRVRSCAAP